MDAAKFLSPAARVSLVALLYLIFSFLDWQQVCVSGGGVEACGGASEWHGIGVIGGLLAIALLAWEGARLAGVRIDLGGIAPALVSVGLAALLLLFTVITFLTHNEFRHWPAWIGLVLSIAIAVLVLARAGEEGVKMPGTSR